MSRKLTRVSRHPHRGMVPVLPQTIRLPHLAYTLRVVWATPASLRETRLGSDREAGAFFIRTGDKSSEIHLARDVPPSLIVHEIVHVLQHIMQRYGAIIEEEKEHTAYIAQYIFDRIYGIRWAGNVGARK